MDAVPAPPPLHLPRTGTALGAQARLLVMGILNVTPDSFSDGGAYVETAAAVARAEAMVRTGADIIDIGGESSRPGSDPVPAATQCDRVLPCIEAIRRRSAVPISIDTTSATVAAAALDAGADMVNDISALREDPELAALIAARGCPVVLMHMQGTPKEMQKAPAYADVVGEVRGFLAARCAAAEAAGIAAHQIALDPGFGFGKTLAHNLTLLAELERLVALGRPLLVGISRKSMIGALLDLPVTERLEGSLAAAVLAASGGARLFRVHDVAATVRALRVTEAVLERRPGGARAT